MYSQQVKRAGPKPPKSSFFWLGRIATEPKHKRTICGARGARGGWHLIEPPELGVGGRAVHHRRLVLRRRLELAERPLGAVLRGSRVSLEQAQLWPTVTSSVMGDKSEAHQQQ